MLRNQVDQVSARNAELEMNAAMVHEARKKMTELIEAGILDAEGNIPMQVSK